MRTKLTILLLLVTSAIFAQVQPMGYTDYSVRSRMNIGNGTLVATHPSASLQLLGTDRGFIPNRLTTAQRDAIVSPANGLYIFNTTSGFPNYYNGSSWVEITTAATTITVPNYSTMRAYAGNDSFLLVTHSRYGGLFHRASSGTENGGTVIVASNGVIWQRVFDGKNYYPEWWEIGGKDYLGQSYSRTAGTGVGSEGDAVVSCVRAAGRYATINYSDTVELDEFVPILQGQVHKGPAIVKRAAPVVSILTGTTAIGGTSLAVSDASSFRTGQTLSVKQAGTTGNFGQTASGTSEEVYLITGISGNTITVNNGLNVQMVAGDTVVTTVDMFMRENSIEGSSDSDNVVTFQNLIFDGNRSQNYHYKTYHVNATIGMYGGFLTVRDCRFVDIPSENILTAGGEIINCTAKRLNGSFVHLTDNQNTMKPELRQVRVSHSIIDSVNLNQSEYSGHSEGFITGSTLSRLIVIDRVRATNGGEFIIANFTQDEQGLKISNSYFKGFKGGVSQRNIDTSAAFARSTYDVVNNEFYNCGIFEFSGTSVKTGNPGRYINITGNTFINSRFYFSDLAYLDFSRNRILFDSSGGFDRFRDSLPYSAGSVTTWAGAGQNSAIFLSSLNDRIHVKDNYISSFPTIATKVATAITFQMSGTAVRKDGAVDIPYFYLQDVKVDGNTIDGFAEGITATATSDKQTVGWTFSRNTVYVTRDPVYSATVSAGMRVPPGCVASDNTIYVHHESGPSVGIVVQGVTATNSTKLLGAIIEGNRVFGKTTYPIYVGPGTASYNSIIRNNVYNYGSVFFETGTASTNSYVSGNIKIDSSVLPAYTAPQSDGFRRVGENKSNY